MEMTPFRWTAALIAGCLIVAVAILNSDSTRHRGDMVEANLLARERRNGDQANALGARLRFTQLMDSTRAAIARSRNASPIRVFRDGGLPVEARAALDSLAWRAARGVRDSGRTGIDIVFLYDTVSWVRGVRNRQFTSPVTYLLPRGANDRCTVILRLANNPAMRVQVVRVFRTEEAAQQLLGPCAFYRAFGTPGREVDNWLRQGGWAFAGDGSWSRPAPTIYLGPDPDGGHTSYWLEVMGMGGAQCASGQTDDCERAVLDRPRPVRWSKTGNVAIWNGNILYEPYPPLGWGRRYAYSGRDLGRGEVLLLADMVRTLGRERFARFWTSNEPLPVAFSRAAGESLGQWTSRWVVEQYGSVTRHGPGVSAWTAAVSMLLFVLAIFVAIRVSAHRQYT